MNIKLFKPSPRENWILVFGFAIVLFSATAILSPTFRSLENIRNLIIQLTPLMLVTLGQVLVILTGGIDLSVGSMLSLSTVLAATLMDKIGILPSAGVICLIAIIFGLVNGVFISTLEINPFIMTLATGVIAQGIALQLLPGPGGTIPRNFTGFIFGPDFLGLPPYTWIAIGLFLLVAFILYKKKFGLNIYSIGGNRDASFLAGIPVKWTNIAVYICSSLIAVFAGFLLTARIASGDPLVGKYFTLDSIGAAVVGGASLAGGRGGALGIFGGVLILGSINNILNMLNIIPYWQFVLKSIIIIATIAIAIRIEKLGSSKRSSNG